MDNDFEAMIKHSLRKKAEGIEFKEDLLYKKVKVKMADKCLREEKRMKKHLKGLVAAAIICAIGVTGYATQKAKSLYSHTEGRYTSMLSADEIEDKFGKSVKFVETFENGYEFLDMSFGVSGASSEDDTIMEEGNYISIGYCKDGKNVVLGIEEKIDGIIYESGYTENVYKFVPSDYERTEEDILKEEKGELYISFGSENIEEMLVQNYAWEDGGSWYSLTGLGTEIPQEEFEHMVFEIKNS